MSFPAFRKVIYKNLFYVLRQHVTLKRRHFQLSEECFILAKLQGRLRLSILSRHSQTSLYCSYYPQLLAITVQFCTATQFVKDAFSGSAKNLICTSAHFFISASKFCSVEIVRALNKQTTRKDSKSYRISKSSSRALKRYGPPRITFTKLELCTDYNLHQFKDKRVIFLIPKKFW